MLKLTSSFSKKVPVVGSEYSSQSYHATVEVELPSGLTTEQIQARIHETFELVRSSVEAELNGSAKSAMASQVSQPTQQVMASEQSESVPGRQVLHPAIPPLASAPAQPAQPTQPRQASANAASFKQLSFLRELAMRKGVAKDELLDEVRNLYGATALENLTRQQASKLIERLSANRERRAVA